MTNAPTYGRPAKILIRRATDSDQVRPESSTHISGAAVDSIMPNNTASQISGNWCGSAGEDRTERNDLGVGVEAHSDEQRLHDAIPHDANPQGQCEYRESGTPHQPGPQGCPRRDPPVDGEGEPRRNQKEVAVTDDDRPRLDGRGKVEPEPVDVEVEHPRVIGRIRRPVHHRVQPRQTRRHRDHQQRRCRFAGSARPDDRCSPDREKHDQRADLEVDIPVGDSEELRPRRHERTRGAAHPGALDTAARIQGGVGERDDADDDGAPRRRASGARTVRGSAVPNPDRGFS